MVWEKTSLVGFPLHLYQRHLHNQLQNQLHGSNSTIAVYTNTNSRTKSWRWRQQHATGLVLLPL